MLVKIKREKKTVWPFFSKLNTAYNPAILLLDTFPRELNTGNWTKT